MSQDSPEPCQSFSYDILDLEAAKISSLILSVQQLCLSSDSRCVATKLYNWAEELFSKGEKLEAEFLYLTVISRFNKPELAYPVQFPGLRNFARLVVEDLYKQEATRSEQVLEVLSAGALSIQELEAA